MLSPLTPDEFVNDSPCFYQVHPGRMDVERSGVRILPFAVFCRETAMP
jgi:hypothetical protein